MANIRDVRFERDHLIVELADGRTLTAPLSHYARLQSATPEQRAAWQPAGAGHSVHWPAIDEDISLDALAGHPLA